MVWGEDVPTDLLTLEQRLEGPENQPDNTQWNSIRAT